MLSGTLLSGTSFESCLLAVTEPALMRFVYGMACAMYALPSSQSSGIVTWESVRLITRTAAYSSLSGRMVLANRTPSEISFGCINQSAYGARQFLCTRRTGMFCSVAGATSMRSLVYTRLTFMDDVLGLRRTGLFRNKICLALKFHIICWLLNQS